jgi:protein-L-isoaspartate(D-aspartate) O-methyltransferase
LQKNEQHTILSCFIFKYGFLQVRSITINQSQFETARKMMVDCQIRPSKVTNESVLKAFSAVPREAFVGKSQRAIAYVDEDLPLPGGRYLMEPMVFSRLVQALDVDNSSSVLVIGAGCGYGTAILAHLASSVIAVEARAQLVDKAQEILVMHGVDNAVIIKSRLVEGHPEDGPYDRILIEGAVETVPEPLLEQLAPKGKLVAVFRPQGLPSGVASLWMRAGSSFVRSPLFDARVPNLDEFNKKPEFVF